MTSMSPSTSKRHWLTANAATQLITAATTVADSLGVEVVIHVADPSGNPIAMLRMDGAPLFSVEVAAKKAWTAAASRTPTSLLREVFNADPTLVHALAPKIENLMAVGGAAPILLDGSVVGSIGVSGATEVQDQQIADAALKVLNLGQ